jgi:hypothetical protein
MSPITRSHPRRLSRFSTVSITRGQCLRRHARLRIRAREHSAAAPAPPSREYHLRPILESGRRRYPKEEGAGAAGGWVRRRIRVGAPQRSHEHSKTTLIETIESRRGCDLVSGPIRRTRAPVGRAQQCPRTNPINESIAFTIARLAFRLGIRALESHVNVILVPAHMLNQRLPMSRRPRILHPIFQFVLRITLRLDRMIIQ